jgi:hypothetical protein
MDAEHCPECGAEVAGGRAGCQAMFDALVTPGAGPLGLSAERDLAFDAYCMQHPETYCKSAKSYAAHLMRLCCGLEFGGDPLVYRAIQRWLNGAVPLEKPEVLSARGTLTVADVQTAPDAAELERRVQAWADEVWLAYAAQHALAREWIGQARSPR